MLATTTGIVVPDAVGRGQVDVEPRADGRQARHHEDVGVGQVVVGTAVAEEAHGPSVPDGRWWGDVLTVGVVNPVDVHAVAGPCCSRMVNQIDEGAARWPLSPLPAAPTHELAGARFTSLATPQPRVDRDRASGWSSSHPGAGVAHRLTREEVFVVLDGRAEVRLDGAVSVAEPGDAIVVPPEARVRPRRRRRTEAAARRSAACRWAVRGMLADGVAVHPAVGRVTEPDVPLARLFAMAYRLLVDGLHERLAARGWTDVRPSFGFVLLALREGPAPLRDLPAAMGTSKQAVSKLIDAMVATGYVERAADPGDSRGKLVALSRRGRDLLAAVEDIYRELESGWADVLGEQQVAGLRHDLTAALRAAHGGRCPPSARWRDAAAV